MSTSDGPSPQLVAKMDQVVAALQERLNREVERVRKQLAGADGDTLSTIVTVTESLSRAIEKQPHLVASVTALALIRLAQQGQAATIEESQ